MKRHTRKMLRVAMIALLILLPLDIFRLRQQEVYAQTVGAKGLKYEEFEDLAAAKLKLTKSLESAAKESKLDLSPEITDVLVKDLIREKTGQGIPFDKISVSPTRAKELTSILGAMPKGRKLTLQEIEGILAEWKVDRTVPRIPEQIATNSRLALRLPQ